MSTKVILGRAQGEITEKKSRFIGTIAEVHSEEEALAFIDEMRKEYWDARHNCFAYVIGQAGELSRFSDDKEPSGTAGKPILDALSGSGIRNACIVVTRYFGGVLLGTGGLVRAYTEAACAAINSALEEGCCMELIDGSQVDMSFDYKHLGKIENIIQSRSAGVLLKDYGENVSFSLAVPDAVFDAFSKDVIEATSGDIAPARGKPLSFCPSGQGAIIYTF